MALPPPLPPNRPTSSKQRGNLLTTTKTLSPRHSWAGGSNYNVDTTSPPDTPVPIPPRSPLHQPPPLPPFHGTPPVAMSGRPLPPTPSSPTGGPSDSTMLFPSEDDKFSLTELVDNYSSIFPIKICVVKGFYSDRGEDSAIAVDELYHFHFVKRSKVVSIRDVGKKTYVVPLNSSAKFGVLYEQGTRVFSTVEDIMNAKTLPSVVGVGTGYVGNTPESSVNRYEVLVVKGIEKGGRFRRKAPTLKVFSITKNMEKNLSKEVYGKFSTDPFSTQMYLPEFLKHIPDAIPTKAKLYLDFESGDPLPDYLTTESVTIERLFVETSIIATPLSEEDIQSNTVSSGDSETVDIPISLDIEVSVIPPAEDDDYEKLTYDTMNLLTHFDPTTSATTHPAVEVDDDEEYSAVANQLFKAVRKGFENEGLNIETPTKIRSLSILKAQENNTYINTPRNSTRESSVELDGYEDMDTIEKIRSEGAPTSPKHDSTSRPPIPAPYLTPTSPTRENPSPDPPPRPVSNSPPISQRKKHIPPSPPQRPPHTLTGESQDVPKLASAPGKGRSGKPSSGKYPFVQPGKVQPVKAIQEDPSSSGGSGGSLPPPRTIKRPASASNNTTTPPVISGPPVSRRPPIKKQSSDPLPAAAFPPGPEYGNTPDSRSPPPVPEYGNTPDSRSPPPVPEYGNTPDKSPQKTKMAKKPAVLPEIYENGPRSPVADVHDNGNSTTVSTEALDSLRSTLDDLSTKVKGLERKRSLGKGGADLSQVMPRLERTVSLTGRLERDVQSLQQGMAEIRDRLEAIAGQVERVGGARGRDKGEETGDGDGEENKNPELAVLDCGEIQKMLDLIGMSKYQQTFREAGIDGDILVECDDKILLEDLSVTSRLDRLKLIQIISGKRSVRSILQKSYVAFQPRN